MGKLLLSLDEIDRVMRLNGITSNTGLEDKTGITRKTWAKARNTRELSIPIMQAIYDLGGRPDRITVGVEADDQIAA
ncbi:MAG TPA: XRE family transcriptional regulator [Corynebacterium pollutisoli]|nr:XRE family transcriptional regulator [Corynebacterium pollutisoli]